MQRRYIFDKIINFRDLGGYPCPGGATKFGRVFRCGIPKTPTESDIEILKSLGVKTVIDLRGNGEKNDMPSYFETDESFEYRHISLLEANPALTKDCKDPVKIYASSLIDYKDSYAQALRTIAACEKPAVIHCFLGKDRTGLLSALLLSAAGVSREDIVADYQVTFTYIIDFFRKEAASGSGLIWETDENLVRSLPENMEKTLDFIDENFGGIDGYFHFIGLSDENITEISGILK